MQLLIPLATWLAVGVAIGVIADLHERQRARAGLPAVRYTPPLYAVTAVLWPVQAAIWLAGKA